MGFLIGPTYNICINIYTTENPFIGDYSLPNLFFSDISEYRDILKRHLEVYLPKLILKPEQSTDCDISKKQSILVVTT